MTAIIRYLVKPTNSHLETVALIVLAAYQVQWWVSLPAFAGVALLNEGLRRSRLGGGS